LKFQPIIKWTGSKRHQSEQIISHFPKEIETYYEPFVGGGSVLRQLLESKIKVNAYECSDICKPLIDLWNEIKNNPEKLYQHYKQEWNEFIHNTEHYYNVRTRFNEKQNPYDFLFLSRTCMNGMSRFNNNGEFNTSRHIGRNGIEPDRLKTILYDWSELLNSKSVSFYQQDYSNISSGTNDVLYLDPPYANTKGLYYGCLNYNEFWNWIRKQRGFYVFSFDGVTSYNDNTFAVPNYIYTEHIYMSKSISGFKKMHQEQEYVRESLYIK
jgi:DNA adenine methylase